ncbi:MAG: hypothetical protein L6W00_01115 [Lentisphaeria bacterium]|nr:MAG: hypothetical protein L6W00_01115 [Lentisphaeria bacterium]
MINFFACQPALNYGFKKPDPTMPWQKSSDDPAVRRVWEETKNIMKFWLDLGCDGFRVDMAPSLVKGDPDGDGIREIWHYYRSWLDENYPEAVLISEWSCPPKAIDAGFHIDFMIHFGQEGFRDLFLRENCFFSRDGKGGCIALHRRAHRQPRAHRRPRFRRRTDREPRYEPHPWPAFAGGAAADTHLSHAAAGGAVCLLRR